ncbi:hypothetical protein MUN89_02380 [Halobacillus salinarum]|uniref:Uncharacterized protein n=1 Tax=Halobacillus salinarum TaxID=2932257 RepID=A0ABY4EL67_9BACI|nr:hypothetical protein [Halobacillus salinarum]UOQ44821.1 hypothetical protein MUN89_02380 [Halobacillus salinarum]
MFDQVQAMDNIKKSLDYTLQLQSSGGYLYEPTANSFYQHEFHLEHIEFSGQSIKRRSFGRGFQHTFLVPIYLLPKGRFFICRN